MAMDFRDLRVWDEAMTLSEMVYDVTSRFPSDERFGLVSQMRRASVSVPSCIAEGNARGSTKDYLRFLSMAKGSLAELQTQLLLCGRLGFLDRVPLDQVLDRLNSVVCMLHSLRSALRSRLAAMPTSPFPIPHSPP
jgi:four helix bundle protein